MEWDVFISHASEDKEEVARPLKNMLVKAGLNVWLDENELKLGDSLRSKIDHGLAKSRYGVVILSEAFFSKDWTQRELSGLVARESHSQKVVLPIWHRVDREFVANYSPLLADRFAISTNAGLQQVAVKIVQVIRNEPNSSLELISYDLLNNNFVELGVAKWTPKALRLGIEWGIVTEDSGYVKFSDKFIEAICEINRDWATTKLDRFLTKTWLFEQVIRAVIKVTPPDDPTSDDDSAEFMTIIILHLVGYVFEIARTAQVVERYTGGNFKLNSEFTHELRETIDVHLSKITNFKKVRPLMFKTLFDLTKARLILYDKKNVDHSYLLASVIAIVFYKDIIKNLENVFKNDRRRD